MGRLSTAEKNVAVGKRLASVRAAVHLTQAEFAAVLDLSLRAYCTYERGERETPFSLAEKLSDELRIDPLWLMNGSIEEPVYWSMRSVDPQLLEVFMNIVDKWATRTGKTLASDRKAKLVSDLYAFLVASNRPDVNEAGMDVLLSRWQA